MPATRGSSVFKGLLKAHRQRGQNALLLAVERYRFTARTPYRKVSSGATHEPPASCIFGDHERPQNLTGGVRESSYNAEPRLYRAMHHDLLQSYSPR